MTKITDLYLKEINGQFVYVDADPYNLKGFGSTPPVIPPPPAPTPILTPALISNITAATNVINGASAMIPGQSVVIQTKFSKVANTVASIAGTVAAVGAALGAASIIGAPLGVIIGVVGAVVAAVAAILGKIFARAKSKEYDAERAQYETANAQLRIENSELDLKYENLKANMASLRIEVSKFTGIDFTFNKDQSVKGLGLCIFNCKAKASKEMLNTAKQQYESLKAAQDQKVKLSMELLDEWNILTDAVINFKKKGNDNAMLIIGFGLATAIGGYFAFVKK